MDAERAKLVLRDYVAQRFMYIGIQTWIIVKANNRT